jgi:hypothetical protein
VKVRILAPHAVTLRESAHVKQNLGPFRGLTPKHRAIQVVIMAS